jgi:4-amino-4-deoxy-L-arabinose transferase-like glycosyltransferase
VPGPLAAILAIVVVAGLLWALLVPPWQSPDEFAHFAYAQSLAERFALPGDPLRPMLSNDELLAERSVGAEALSFRPGQIRPDWSPQDFQAYRAAASRGPSRSNGGGANPESYEPPLYYLYADVAYWATSAGNAFDQYYGMRIWGVALLALTVIATWLLIGELLGPRRVPQLAGSAVVGLFPGETFISTSINPDGLMIALWTLALWLGARVIKRAARPGDAVALIGVTAAAALTQPSSYALVPAVVLALIIGLARCPPGRRRASVRASALAGAAACAPVIAWVVTRVHGNPALSQVGPKSGEHAVPFNVRQFLSYIWQFYLPRLPGMTPNRVTPGLSVYNVWVREAWGTFGWLDVPMASWVYTAVGSFTAAIGVASAAIVASFRDRLSLQLVAFYGLALVALLFGLHLTEYRSLINGQGAFLQGRYLLPVLGLFGVAVALVVSRLPPRWQGPACGAVLPAMLLLQGIALASVAATYYT